MTALLHVGRVAHLRRVPFRHRFVYRLWMLSFDLDAPDHSGLLLFRHNAPGLVSLHDADHGPRDGSALRPWVAARLSQAGLGAFAARIRFLVIPRVLGYGFSPIAFFFCFDAAGRLGAVLHQVKNTFGDQFGYLLPVADAAGVVHQSAAKRLHVSPFFDMAGGYRFAFTRPDFTPGERFAIAIRYGAADALRMTVTMRLDARPLTDAALAGMLLMQPLMPAKVIAAIHWQALRLWLRGASFHRAPDPPEEDVIPEPTA